MKQAILFMLGILLFSGCVIGADSKNLADELAELRKISVPDGLLVPAQLTAREKYRNDLLAFRKQIPSGDTALSNYLSGSVALINMQNQTDEAVNLLRGISPDLFECGPFTNSGKAIMHLQNARTSAQTALNDFQAVQANAEIANALGGGYVSNATKTTTAILTVHESRINDIKSYCGQT